MPWHRRVVQALLYGRNVDRDRKARARLGLAMIGFAAIYCVIAGKLVIFAIAPDSHVARRAGAGDAVATARPEILDRNGEILATDVKRPSLFAEPRRIIDSDEAIELLTAVMPDLEINELRQRLGSRRGFAWLKREITPQQQDKVHRLGIPGVGFLTENKRIYPNGPEVSHLLGYVNVDNTGVAGIENWLDAQGLADLHRAGFASDRQQEPVVTVGRPARAARGARRDDRRQGQVQGQGGRRQSSTRCAPAKWSRWCRSPTTTRTARAARSTRTASTG